MNFSSADYVMLPQLLGLWIGTTMCGVATWLACHRVLAIAVRPPGASAQAWEYEERRLAGLRQRYALYRWCEPFVQALVPFAARWPIVSSTRTRNFVERALTQAFGTQGFRVNEFLAFTQFQSLLAGVLSFPIALNFLACESALLAAGGIAVATIGLCLDELRKAARARMQGVKQRLPFCVDLLALLVDAGATPQEAMATVVAESRDSPAGHEMALVLRQTEANQTLMGSLQQLGKRLQDPEVDELVLAISNADRLGTPLSQTLLKMAEQMRLRRTQSLEKLAGQAHTMIVFPSFVVMLACLITVGGPIYLAMKDSSLLGM